MNFSPTMLARIKDLLASPLAANQQLALTLIEAHGLPEIFRDDLLVDYLSGNDRPRVTLGIRLAKALGTRYLHEALWYRYLAIGTVGTSYGWVKSFLEIDVQEKAYQTFKQFGYPAPGNLRGDLEKLQTLMPELDTPRLALLICLSGKHEKDARINTKIWSAFKYLVELDVEAYFQRCLKAMVFKDSLTLGLLRKLPEAIGQLTELKKITVYGRGDEALARFPEILLQMPQLTEVRLLVNGIEEIPEEIGQLQNLRILDLTFNPIDYLPRTILQLPRLFVLAVSKPMLTDRGKESLKVIEASKKPGLTIVLKTNDSLD